MSDVKTRPSDGTITVVMLGLPLIIGIGTWLAVNWWIGCAAAIWTFLVLDDQPVEASWRWRASWAGPSLAYRTGQLVSLAGVAVLVIDLIEVARVGLAGGDLRTADFVLGLPMPILGGVLVAAGTCLGLIGALAKMSVAERWRLQP
jgi:hypothetical protein